MSPTVGTGIGLFLAAQVVFRCHIILPCGAQLVYADLFD